jgi:hypothetical protein
VNETGSRDCTTLTLQGVTFLLFSKLDTMRDEFFTERKERERVQSQKDKTKRELEAAQSRIASLQEQVLITELSYSWVISTFEKILQSDEVTLSRKPPPLTIADIRKYPMKYTSFVLFYPGVQVSRTYILSSKQV